MSSFPGHLRISQKAVELLADAKNPVYRAIGSAGVPTNVVARDILDVVILGHWADFGQCHHFMRRFDGESERQAYDEAVHWIWRNALEAAGLMSPQIARLGMPVRGASGGPTSSQALGNALHALQDSFAEGHAGRGPAAGGLPGNITRIKRYSGSEKRGTRRRTRRGRATSRTASPRKAGWRSRRPCGSCGWSWTAPPRPGAAGPRTSRASSSSGTSGSGPRIR